LIQNFFDLSRAMLVINIRVHSIEPNSSEQLLGIKTAVWFAELSMSLGGNFSELVIKGHGNLVL